MREINKIESVRNFSFFKELIFQKQDIIFCNQKKISKKFKNRVNFILFKNHLFIDDKEGNYLVLDVNFNITAEGNDTAFFYINENVIGIQSISENGLITKISKDGFNVFFEELNLRIFSTGSVFKEEKFVYRQSNIEISFLDLKKGVSIFSTSQINDKKNQTTKENPTSVKEFSGIYKNTLVCTLENGGVLGLDIDKVVQVFYFSNAQLRAGLYQKEKDSPIFVGLKHWTYLELNAETGELIKKIDLQPQLKVLGNIPKESPCWLSINTTKYENNLIYFFADKNCVGVFDLNKIEIIDFHQFNFIDKKTTLKSGIESLQIKGNEIYCLDTNNDLHILETTSTAV